MTHPCVVARGLLSLARMRRAGLVFATAGVWISLFGCGVDAPSSGGSTTEDGSGTEEVGSATDGGVGSSSGTGTGMGPAETGSTEADDAQTTGSTGLDDDATTGEPDVCVTDVLPGDTVVITEHGPVEGFVTEDGPVAFLGIPYAAPPVGENRWAPPEPPQCWTETLDATERGPVCTQLDTPDGPVVGEEDCLQVNVWTPAADDAGRPVMVFVHGGGNSIGSGADPLYDGANLSAAGDQVVVTFNYRLGVLGWLTHPDLPAVNFALRDQIAALRWVQANAAAFGGDPTRVTVFGESAGAVNTCTLLGAPEAAGLFQGAIIQSGACVHRDAQTYAAQMSTPFVEATGCAAEDDPIACLRELGGDVLMATEPTGFPSVAGASAPWGPSIDPDSLPMQSLDAMAAGLHNDVPVIIGANAEETFRDAPPVNSNAVYVALVVAAFGSLAGEVLAMYPAADYDTPRDAYIALTTDSKFVCNARRSLRAVSNGRSPAYRYHFSYDDYYTPNGGDTGAFHGLELVYLFGNFDAIIPGVDYPITAADEAMRNTMQALWSSFAATGTPQSDPAWPSYDSETDSYLEIAQPLGTGEGVRTAHCDFWAGITGD